MTMNRDLFLAILSMDSYNRGYGQGVKDLNVVIGQTKIGNATISSQVDIDEGSAAIAAGFYALAYDMTGVSGFADGERVIAYRGTDSPLSDIWNGYGPAFGAPDGLQALLTLEFYRAVAGANAAKGKTLVTGHSLGGGLAGLVGSIFGETSVLFDPMPYASAVAKAQQISTEFVVPSSQLAERQRFLNAIGGIGLLPYSTATTSGYYIPAAADEPSSNMLDNWRNNNPIDSYIAKAVNPLNLPADTPLEVTLTNKVGQRHAIGLIILRMFADTLPDRDWEHVAKYWMPALFDDDLARGSGALVRTNEEFGDVATTLQQALAYSVISEGDDAAKPFGDTGIISLFNDANELGKALKEPDVSQIVRDNAEALSQMLVQYAGKLALGDVETVQDDAQVTEGILKASDNGGLLSVDMSAARWSHGVGHSRDYYTCETHIYMASNDNDAIIWGQVA
jgi:hypothetical protein